MSCNEGLRLQAYFDGELDASAAPEVERHLQGCSDCAALLADLETTRQLIRRDVPYHRASTALREDIVASLDREEGMRTPPSGLARAAFQGASCRRGKWRGRHGACRDAGFLAGCAAVRSLGGRFDERAFAVADVGSFDRCGVERPAYGLTVVSVDGLFRSGGLDQNDVFTFKFDTPGTYKFVCSIHPQMMGTIIVK